ncbi:MAG: RNA polymerase sporulation sigma factor SigH [Lachnospiraceae bacterium]|nr:RNA polymerase sporulation sigma factor SigH [Lachnospiraceae bacterium]
MQAYQEFTDEELVIRARDGEMGITEYLMDKYKNLVKSKASTMYILGADREDLIQEGMIGLFKAIRDYDSGRDASFYTFAELCISRQMYTALQASGRKKHTPLNSYVSIYQEHDEEENGAKLIDALENKKERNPEEIVIDKENVETIEKIIETDLSPFERQVLELSMTGMGYSEIAKLLGKDGKSTDNALTRVKSKIRKALSKK